MKRSQVDLVLFGVVIALVAIGIVAICSASYPRHEGAFAVTLRQLTWAGCGLLVMLGALYTPYEWLRTRLCVLASMATAIGLLLACLVPGLGHGPNTDRWLAFGGINVQPSELAKFALMIFLAHVLWRCRRRIREADCLAGILAVVGLTAALVLKQPHLGGAIVIVAASMVVLFVAGAQQRHLLIVIALGLMAVCWSLARHPYQMDRIVAWLHPDQADPSDEAYQAIHCATALARGGWFGRGPGRSIEKFDYLPECYTDSILAVFGEEYGLLGTVLLLAVFMLFAWRGLRIAVLLHRHHHDLFGCYLACGITSVIFLQAMLNFWVTCGLAPQCGVGMPFISYGGSALCSFLAACGLLLNLSRQIGAPPLAGVLR